MIAQLLRVDFNGPHNAYGGERDRFSIVNIETIDKIPEEINAQLSIGNYVLVKYLGKVYLCEKIEKGGYSRKVIDYHPYFDKFSI